MRFLAVFALLTAGWMTPAAAGLLDDVGGYVNLGAGRDQGRSASIDDVTARIGVRIGAYVGVEGETSFGLDRDRYLYSGYCPRTFPPCPTFAPFKQKIALKNAEAGYAVGYFPIRPDADLLLRFGYGASRYTNFSQNSFNFGAGAQYFVSGDNGLRLDYTRHVFTNSTGFGRQALGSGANEFSIAYLRRF